jgi:hypothetical protein
MASTKISAATIYSRARIGREYAADRTFNYWVDIQSSAAQRWDNAISVNDQVNHQVHFNGWLCDTRTRNDSVSEFSHENWKKGPAMHTRNGDFKISKHLD